MRKWIYYCGSWASLIGCLLVASGLESYTGWAMAGCFVGALVLLALAVVLAGLGSCAEQEEDEKPCKERQPQDEAEIWQRMEQHGEELVRDMGAAMMQAERLPEWMQEAAVNMLCDKLADARALAASWMNDHGEP